MAYKCHWLAMVIVCTIWILNGGRIEAELAVYNAMETLEIIPPAAGSSANADAADVINIQAYWQEAKKQLGYLSLALSHENFWD